MEKKKEEIVYNGKMSKYHYKFLLKILKELTKTDTIPLDEKEIFDLKILIDCLEEWK